jgi:UV DNA damage endonuclease
MIGYSNLPKLSPADALKIFKGHTSFDREAKNHLLDPHATLLSALADYNLKNDIFFFQMPSLPDIWCVDPEIFKESLPTFENVFSQKFDKHPANRMRVFLHSEITPEELGSSIQPSSIAIQSIQNQALFLDSLSNGSTHKLILTITDRTFSALSAPQSVSSGFLGTFLSRPEQWPESVRRHLVLENSRDLSAENLIALGTRYALPILYNYVDPAQESLSDVTSVIMRCAASWKPEDGHPVFRYTALSDSNESAATVNLQAFLGLFHHLRAQGIELDFLLEAKDRNLSAIKCIQCTQPAADRVTLEKAWAKHKYTVMEHSPEAYLEIRKLFRGTAPVSPIAFYNALDSAYAKIVEAGHAVNAAQHVWGYFKKKASETEKQAFFEALKDYETGKMPLKSVKNHLEKLALKYNQSYLLGTYYFLS